MKKIIKIGIVGLFLTAMLVYAIAGSYTVALDTKQDAYITSKASTEAKSAETAIVEILDKEITAKENREWTDLTRKCQRQKDCKDKYIVEIKNYLASTEEPK